MTALLDRDFLTADDMRAMIEDRPDLIAAILDALRDKSYQDFPLGDHARVYLAAKRKRLTDASMRTYESFLSKLAKEFPTLQLSDLELPAGGTLLERFLDDNWGIGHTPGTYNVAHAIFSDFFKWQVKRGNMRSSPMTVIERAKPRQPHREVFTADSRRRIVAAGITARDRLALRLLFDYGLRKGALQKIQFKHFDHQRRRLTVFTKGGKVQQIAIPDLAFWRDLASHLLEVDAKPAEFLMCLVKPVPFGSPDKAGRRQTRDVRFPDRMMSMTAMHRWWYRQLEHAGIVADGETSGERMHKARHTAGQRVLDATGDLKLVQRMLGHSSIRTTGDVYVDYDLDQIAEKLARVLEDSE
jgi:integrase